MVEEEKKWFHFDCDGLLIKEEEEAIDGWYHICTAFVASTDRIVTLDDNKKSKEKEDATRRI